MEVEKVHMSFISVDKKDDNYTSAIANGRDHVSQTNFDKGGKATNK